MKRLLAVSWEMPPMYGPRATQVARLLAALGGLDWRSTVICLAPRQGGPHWPDGAAAEPIPGVELVRVASPEEWLTLRVAWRLAPAVRDLPDSKWVWVGRAARSARRAAARGGFEGLVTFAQPWSDHLVGLRVHRATGLPWVAHFSDPWVDSPYPSGAAWQRFRWRRIEAAVIREATSVVFVTDEAAALVMRKYPDVWRKKVSVVPHGFSSCSRRHRVGRDRWGEGAPLRFVYTGRFYAGIRTPIGLLEALARMNRHEPLAGVLDVLFVGPQVESFGVAARALGLESIVTFRGRVSPAEAAETAGNADVLLVIDAPTSGPSVFLPSKLVEYLAFRRPILALTPPLGATATLARRLGCPTAPPDDPPAIEAALSGLIRARRDGTLGVGPSFDAVACEFDIQAIARRFDAVLNGAFSGRAS